MDRGEATIGVDHQYDVSVAEMSLFGEGSDAAGTLKSLRLHLIRSQLYHPLPAPHHHAVVSSQVHIHNGELTAIKIFNCIDMYQTSGIFYSYRWR